MHGGGVIMGRCSHTDAVSHDCTYHYQISGRKTWILKPTETLMEEVRENKGDTTLGREGFLSSFSDEDGVVRELEITVESGGWLALDTRLWWHRTEVRGYQGVCISVARDVYLGGKGREEEEEEEEEGQGSEGEPEVSNLDCVYSTTSTSEGTLLFTESDMPDCSLGRSNKPNCEVCEVEVGGQVVMGLVSLRDIGEGEVLEVCYSSDEEGGGGGGLQ